MENLKANEVINLPTQAILQESVIKIIEETINKTVKELRKANYIKNTRQTSFWKTEQLLYHYNDFKKAILDKESQIEEIRHNGIPKKSKSITFYSTMHYLNTDEEEKIEGLIKTLENSISNTKRLINLIDNSLNKLKKDKYYKIIELKYFNGETREKIAEIFNADVSTITRNKNRLLNALKINLFSDEVIEELFKI